MKKKNRQRKTQIKPDEAYSNGPISMSRYGKSILVQNKHTPEEYAALQKIMAEHFPIVVMEINQLIEEIASLVKQINPGEILHRAWWEMVSNIVKTNTSEGYSSADSTSIRMVDYLQSVIAGTTPNTNQRTTLLDNEWDELHFKVSSLFQKLNNEYHLCRTAKQKKEDPHYNENIDEFYFKSQIYWCNIRGKRFLIHEKEYLEDVFTPHSSLLKKSFGITSKEFIEEIYKIISLYHSGFLANMEECSKLNSERIELENFLEENFYFFNDISELFIFIDILSLENQWEERNQKANSFLSLEFFDLEKNTDLPVELLNDLAWAPGEEKDFFKEGKFCGWPLRIWPIFKKPFIKINGKYYCFDLYSLTDNIYRVMQKLIGHRNPELKQEWSDTQKRFSEELPFKYLTKLMPNATIYKSIYSPWPSNETWSETDGLLIYENYLFIIEVKGGSFTYTSPTDDFESHIDSLKDLALKPVEQGERFLKYLHSSETVKIYNEEHKEIGELKRDSFKKIVLCAITLDQFTELAAQAQHLPSIGINIAHPALVISMNDLRIYAGIFNNPLIFLHFLTHRVKASQSPYVKVDDEIDHIALYLEHNDYVMYAKQYYDMTSNAPTFHMYGSRIDAFFNEQFQQENDAELLQQEMPLRLFEIIEFLALKNIPDKSTLSNFLLDLSGRCRENLFRAIDNEIERQYTFKRSCPISINEDSNLTIFCWTSTVNRNQAEALKYTKAMMLFWKNKNRLLLELCYSSDNKLTDISWLETSLDGLSKDELKELDVYQQSLKANHVKEALEQQRKIGRNNQCPCGSGKKYKKCCDLLR